MAETTIEWTNFSFNPWWGCAEVSAACDFCYARTFAKRVGHPDLWSPTGKRRFFGNDYWSGPLKWDARARHRGERYRVFCASMADVFDNHPDVEPHRQRLWNTIACTPNLDWQLLTKRIGNAKHMLPADWGDGYPNVWLGATVVTQEECDRDIPKLLRIPARVHFLSCEPLLSDLDITRWLWDEDCGELCGLDWVIAGGESGPKARPMRAPWARSLRDQCVAAGVPFLLKQWGNWAPYDRGAIDSRSLSVPGALDEPMQRFGKKVAGRLLDGRTWDEFPRAACHPEAGDG